MAEAGKQSQTESYPISAKSPSTCPRYPFPALSKPGTFSNKTNLGPTSLTMRRVAGHPLRSSSPAACLPATLKGWHGNPAVTTSTIPDQALPSKVLQSSHIGNRGSTPSCCLRRSTSRQYGSFSTAQTVRHPSKWAPRTPPPAPANSANSFTVPPLYSVS